MARQFTMGARINLNTGNYTGGMADAIRATNQFASTMSQADNTMGRYYDSSGRLRESNGRYARSTRDATLAGNLFSTTMKTAKMAAIALTAALGGVAAVAGAMVSEVDTAQGRIEAMTGATTAEAQNLTAAAAEVYANGWGPSITETANAMAGLKQQIAGMGEENAKQFIQSGYIIQDAFGAPIAQTTKTVNTMMRNFDGLGSTKAFDIITAGFQQGGDYAEDMLDTINEYSMQFSGLGMSADQMMATLIAGSKQGAWNLDKVGDSAKEAFIRLQDGSKESAAGFAAAGLDAEKMSQQIAAGGPAANSAFQATLLGLGNIKNARDREQAGIALFGTQWEDMGDDVVLAMAKGQKGLQGFEGATSKAGDALQNNLGSKVLKMKNSLMVGLADIGAPIVDGLKVAADWAIANMPMILNVISQVGSVVASIMVPAFNALKAVIGFLIPLTPYIFGVGAALLLVGAYFKLMAMRIQIVFQVMRAFFFLLNMNPITLIAIAIGLLIGYLINLAGGWGVVKNAIIGFLPILKQIGLTIWSAVLPILRMLGTTFMAVVNGIKTYVLPVLNSIIFGIVAGFQALVGFVRQHWTLISTVIKIAWALISAQIKTSLGIVTAVIKGGFKLIGAVASNTWKMIQGVIKIAWSIITGLINTGLKLLQGDWQGAWDSMLGMLDGVWSGIKTFFGGLKDLFFDSGKAIMSTLVDGIKAMANGPVDAVKGVLENVREFLPFSDAKKGPLSNLTLNGGKIVTTMAEGIYQQKGALASAMSDVLMDTPGGGTVPIGTADPAGSAAGASRYSKTVIIQKIFETLELNGAEGKDGKELALEMIDYLVDILGGADEIEAAGLGDLLND